MYIGSLVTVLRQMTGDLHLLKEVMDNCIDEFVMEAGRSLGVP
jgi:DNA gyrase/topoisomerase IV subunit B